MSAPAVALVGLLCFQAGYLASRIVGHVRRSMRQGKTLVEAIKPARGERPSRLPKVTEVP